MFQEPVEPSPGIRCPIDTRSVDRARVSTRSIVVAFVTEPRAGRERARRAESRPEPSYLLVVRYSRVSIASVEVGVVNFVVHPGGRRFDGSENTACHTIGQ